MSSHYKVCTASKTKISSKNENQEGHIAQEDSMSK